MGTRRPHAVAWAASLAVALLVACGSSRRPSGTTGPEGAADPLRDGGADATIDSPADAPADALAGDAPDDARAEAAPEGGEDAAAGDAEDALGGDGEAESAADAPTNDASVADVEDAASADASAPCGLKSGFDWQASDASLPDGHVPGDAGPGEGGITDTCGAGETYACGADSYEIVCGCPSAACVCTRNGSSVGSVTYFGCPSCATPPPFSAIAASCAIPY